MRLIVRGKLKLKLKLLAHQILETRAFIIWLGLAM